MKLSLRAPHHGLFAPSVVLALALATAACGPKAGAITATAPGGTKDQSRWPADDRSLCAWKGKPELEASETAGPGAMRPNVRRVYKTLGEGDERHKTLICREIDSNLDGIKDVVRTFNPKGEALHEEADRNYDGRIDTWMTFVDGRLAEEALDTNLDGKPDLWKFYAGGQLQRVRRDRNFDGRPDLWEIYANGRLERIGVDDEFDGHVDRWDRDQRLKYEAEAADRKARDDAMNAELAAKQDAGSSDSPTKDAGLSSPKPAKSESVAPKAPHAK